MHCSHVTALGLVVLLSTVAAGCNASRQESVLRTDQTGGSCVTYGMEDLVITEARGVASAAECVWNGNRSLAVRYFPGVASSAFAVGILLPLRWYLRFSTSATNQSQLFTIAAAADPANIVRSSSGQASRLTEGDVITHARFVSNVVHWRPEAITDFQPQDAMASVGAVIALMRTHDNTPTATMRATTLWLGVRDGRTGASVVVSAEPALNSTFYAD